MIEIDRFRLLFRQKYPQASDGFEKELAEMVRQAVIPFNGDTLTSTIVEDVCYMASLPASVVLSRQRFREYIIPKHMIVFLLYVFTDLSTTRIAEKVNLENHASVLHAVKNIRTALEMDYDEAEFMKKVFARIWALYRQSGGDLRAVYHNADIDTPHEKILSYLMFHKPRRRLSYRQKHA